MGLFTGTDTEAERKSRKLTLDAASQLRAVSLGEITPYALLWTPVYLLLKRNGKFVQLKRAFDFFSTADLEKLRTAGGDTVFLPLDPFPWDSYKAAGMRTRSFLDTAQSRRFQQNEEGPKAELEPSSYELSSMLIRMLPTVWGSTAKLQHEAVAAWTDGFCDEVPHEILEQARAERGTDFLRECVAVSAWVVFLSAHLGKTDPDFLDALRNSVFAGIRTGLGESDELVSFARKWVTESPDSLSLLQLMDDWSDRAGQKLSFRLERVLEQLQAAAKGDGT